MVTASFVLWRRGERPRALRLLVANPLANGHLLFATMLVAIYVITNNGFFAQGRNWYPFLPAIFWEAVEHAPRALASRRAARWLSRGVLATLLLYGVVGSYWAMRAVKERFYGVVAVSQQPSREAALLTSPELTLVSRLHDLEHQREVVEQIDGIAR